MNLEMLLGFLAPTAQEDTVEVSLLQVVLVGAKDLAVISVAIMDILEITVVLVVAMVLLQGLIINYFCFFASLLLCLSDFEFQKKIRDCSRMSWKTRKRQRQRGGAAAEQSACPIGTENYKDMALHAIMDMVHDHGLDIFTKVAPLVTGHRTKEDAGIGSYASEENAKNYFFSANANAAVGTHTRRLSTMIPNLPQRIEDQIEFLLNQNTAYFRNDQLKGFVRFFFNSEITDNSRVGVVQDNGELIYEKIGGLNLLTFGSILDQAKKPKNPDSDPIYMDVGPGTQLRINACEYGINEVHYIQISGFELKSNTPVVKCYFGKKSGGGKITWVDAINPIRKIDEKQKDLSPSVNPTFGQDKYINVDTILNAGYFTSIAKIAQVAVTNPEYVDSDNKKRLFYLGKFQGDTTLVASISPEINLNPLTINPFFNLGEAKWIFPKGRVNPILENVMLKTFDQLNFVRAVIKGRPVVYQQAKTLKNDMYFLYIPGQDLNAGIKPVDVATLKTKFTKTITESMIPNIKVKYDALIKTLTDLIVMKDGVQYVPKSNLDISNIHKEVLNTPEKQANAAILINRTIVCLTNLCNVVIAGVQELQAKLNTDIDASAVKNTYKFIENLIPNFIPFTTVLKLKRFSVFDILILKQKQNESFLKINNSPIQGKLVLRFKEAFETDPTNTDKLEDTPLFYGFLDILEPQDGGNRRKKKLKEQREQQINLEFNAILRAEVKKNQIETSNQELINELLSNPEPFNLDILENICIILNSQYKENPEFIEYIDTFKINLHDSYPLFYKFHSFLENIFSKIKEYTLFSSLIKYIITVSIVLQCVENIDYIYDTIFFTELRKETINFFIDLAKLNLETDNIDEIERFMLVKESGYFANLSSTYLTSTTNDFSETGSIPNYSSPTASSYQSPQQRALSRLSGVSGTSYIAPLPIQFGRYKPPKGQPGSISTIRNPSTRGSIPSSKGSSELSFVKKTSTTSTNTSRNNSVGADIGLQLFLNSNSDSNSANSNTSNLGAFSANASGYAGNTESNKRRFTLKGGVKGSKYKINKESRHASRYSKNIMKIMKIKPHGLQIVGNSKLIHKYVSPLLKKMDAELKFNLFTFKQYNTILQSTLTYNPTTRIYSAGYENDSTSIIAISILYIIASFQIELEKKLTKYKQNYKITRSKLYITTSTE